MARFRDTAKFIVSSAILAAIAFFFYRAFRSNWAAIQARPLVLDYGFLLLAALCILATNLVPTYGWQLTINSLSKTGRLSFSQSVAAVNAGSLVKYIPGKIWAYALQMYWLAAAGFSKSLVVYVNAINLFVSLITSLMLGLVFLLPNPGKVPLSLTLGSLLALVAVDIASLKFHDAVFKGLVRLYNRLFRRQLEYFAISTRLVIELHLLHLVGAAAFGLAAYFACLGIGYPVTRAEIPLLMASLLLADTIAFLAVVVPGGLGVREGLMYAMLGGVTNGALALTLPLATRVLHMLVDVGLGATALRLLRTLDRGKGAPPAAATDALPVLGKEREADGR